MEPRSARFDRPALHAALTDDSVVEAFVEAMTEPVHSVQRGQAWAHAATLAANWLIEHQPEAVAGELLEADTAWNEPAAWAPPADTDWWAMLAGYRDTLREWTERGSDV